MDSLRVPAPTIQVLAHHGHIALIVHHSSRYTFKSSLRYSGKSKITLIAAPITMAPAKNPNKPLTSATCLNFRYFFEEEIAVTVWNRATQIKCFHRFPITNLMMVTLSMRTPAQLIRDYRATSSSSGSVQIMSSA